MIEKRGKQKVSSGRKTYNNRLLYSLITLGILMIVAMGVYASTTISDTGINATSLNVTNNVSASYFLGDGRFLTGITATASPAGTNGAVQFNDAGSTGGNASLFFINSTNGYIGIGTSSPQYLLDLNGSDTKTASIYLRNSLPQNRGLIISSIGNVSPIIASGVNSRIISADSALEIARNAKLVIPDSNVADEYWVRDNISEAASTIEMGQSGFQVYLAPAGTGNIAWNETIYSDYGNRSDPSTLKTVVKQGNFGIGTNTPGNLLHVYGSATSLAPALIIGEDYGPVVGSVSSSSSNYAFMVANGFLNPTVSATGASSLFEVQSNGAVIISNLTGSGNAYVCVNSAGTIYRSATACA